MLPEASGGIGRTPYRARARFIGRFSRVGTRTATSPCRSTRGVKGPASRLLVLHDDAEREFDYTAGAETSLAEAATNGCTVVSIKSDWATVFTEAEG